MKYTFLCVGGFSLCVKGKVWHEDRDEFVIEYNETRQRFQKRNIIVLVNAKMLLRM